MKTHMILKLTTPIHVEATETYLINLPSFDSLIAPVFLLLLREGIFNNFSSQVITCIHQSKRLLMLCFLIQPVCSPPWLGNIICVRPINMWQTNGCITTALSGNFHTKASRQYL